MTQQRQYFKDLCNKFKACFNSDDSQGFKIIWGTNNDLGHILVSVVGGKALLSDIEVIALRHDANNVQITIDSPSNIENSLIGAMHSYFINNLQTKVMSKYYTPSEQESLWEDFLHINNKILPRLEFDIPKLQQIWYDEENEFDKRQESLKEDELFLVVPSFLPQKDFTLELEQTWKDAYEQQINKYNVSRINVIRLEHYSKTKSPKFYLMSAN